ncbi:MAG: hypothetical protein ABJA78_10335 [Ferruginibacter sp.]
MNPYFYRIKQAGDVLFSNADQQLFELNKVRLYKCATPLKLNSTLLPGS